MARFVYLSLQKKYKSLVNSCNKLGNEKDKNYTMAEQNPIMVNFKHIAKQIFFYQQAKDNSF